MKSARPVLIALLLAVAMVLMASVTGDAAMSASLSSDHARHGDWILLLTDDHQGTWDYRSFSGGRQAIYLAPVSGDDAAACTGQPVGRLEWRGNRGGVAFRVPNLSPGVYNAFIDVVFASPSCWVITGGLTIGNVAADNQAVAAGWTVNSLARASQQPPRPQSNGLWLPIVGALIALAALSLFGFWKRQKRVHARAIDR